MQSWLGSRDCSMGLASMLTACLLFQMCLQTGRALHTDLQTAAASCRLSMKIDIFVPQASLPRGFNTELTCIY